MHHIKHKFDLSLIFIFEYEMVIPKRQPTSTDQKIKVLNTCLITSFMFMI